MARASKALAKAKSGSTGTSLATIDAELNTEVANLKNQIGAPSGNKIKIDATGDIVLPDGQSLGNEIQVAVVNFASRNLFYASAYNPNNIVPPDCYAMGSERHDFLQPEDDSPDKQADKCGGCPLNAFGSGNGGIGKACQNRYYVAVVVVDPDNPDAAGALDAPIYLLDLSPSNLKSFEGAIRAATGALGHWAKAQYTVSAKNAGTYAKVSWLDPEPNPYYAVHYARRAEVESILFRKPDFSQKDNTPKRGRAPARRAAAPARR
ncbi:MAG TPA: hypothetical protein PKZ27_02930 [Rhodocyclaceae bacterium]|nr:hypothetical protein [Burkholderiaceae bacterium]HRP74520.1 hypothetical protein [Rhodocyclaceae bacterium]